MAGPNLQKKSLYSRWPASMVPRLQSPRMRGEALMCFSLRASSRVGGEDNLKSAKTGRVPVQSGGGLVISVRSTRGPIWADLLNIIQRDRMATTLIEAHSSLELHIGITKRS